MLIRDFRVMTLNGWYNSERTKTVLVLSVLHDLSLFVYYLVLMTEVLIVGFVCLSGVCNITLYKYTC